MARTKLNDAHGVLRRLWYNQALYGPAARADGAQGSPIGVLVDKRAGLMTAVPVADPKLRYELGDYFSKETKRRVGELLGCHYKLVERALVYVNARRVPVYYDSSAPSVYADTRSIPVRTTDGERALSGTLLFVVDGDPDYRKADLEDLAKQVVGEGRLRWGTPADGGDQPWTVEVEGSDVVAELGEFAGLLGGSTVADDVNYQAVNRAIALTVAELTLRKAANAWDPLKPIPSKVGPVRFGLDPLQLCAILGVPVLKGAEALRRLLNQKALVLEPGELRVPTPLATEEGEPGELVVPEEPVYSELELQAAAELRGRYRLDTEGQNALWERAYQVLTAVQKGEAVTEPLTVNHVLNLQTLSVDGEADALAWVDRVLADYDPDDVGTAWAADAALTKTPTLKGFEYAGPELGGYVTDPETRVAEDEG